MKEKLIKKLEEAAWKQDETYMTSLLLSEVDYLKGQYELDRLTKHATPRYNDQVLQDYWAICSDYYARARHKNDAISRRHVSAYNIIFSIMDLLDKM